MALGETLREFGVKVSLNWDAKKFEEAQNKVDKFGGKLKGFAFEIAGTAAGLFGIGKAATFYARNIQNQADLLGISTEALQDYGYAAKVAADVNQDELNGSLQTLADTMDKARAGNLEARQSLMQIGAAGGNADAILSRLSDPTYKVTDAFNDLSKGIQHLSVTSPRAASRLAEMTTGNAKLYNLLKLGPKAIGDLTAEGQKNAAVSAKMIAEGNKLDIQLSKIYAIFRKFGVEIGIVTMSKLMPLINQFTRWFGQNKKLIASGIVEFVKDFVKALQVMFEVTTAVARALTPLIDKVGGMANAIKIAMAAFVAFKVIGIVSTLASMGSAIASFAGTLIGIGPAVTTVISSIAGLASTVAGVLGGLTAIVAAAYAGYEIGTKISDLINEKTGGEGIGGKIYDWLHPNENAEILNRAGPAPKPRVSAAAQYSQITPSRGAAAQANVPQALTQQNTFQTNTTVNIGPGTSANQGAAMVQKGVQDAHEQLMDKAKQDAATSRQY
jgi:hypothetical protein